MKYASTVELESSLPEFKGVKFTIHNFSHGRRSKLRVRLSETFDKVRELTEEQAEELAEFKALTETPKGETGEALIVALPDERDAAPPPSLAPETADNDGAGAEAELERKQFRFLRNAAAIGEKIETISSNEVDPVYMEFGFKSMTGIEINGAVPTWKTLYEDGPEDLCLEVLTGIKRKAGIDMGVKAALKLPSISGAVVDGEKNDLTVPVAGEPETTGDVTAQSSSPS